MRKIGSSSIIVSILSLRSFILVLANESLSLSALYLRAWINSDVDAVCSVYTVYLKARFSFNVTSNSRKTWNEDPKTA